MPARLLSGQGERRFPLLNYLLLFRGSYRPAIERALARLEAY